MGDKFYHQLIVYRQLIVTDAVGLESARSRRHGGFAFGAGSVTAVVIHWPFERVRGAKSKGTAVLLIFRSPLLLICWQRVLSVGRQLQLFGCSHVAPRRRRCDPE